MKTTPYPFQVEGVEFIESKNGRGIIGDQMGLGKSYQALLYAHWNPDSFPALVICPANVKRVWQDEAHKHFNMPSVVLEKRKPERGLYRMVGQFKLFIINYEILPGWKDWIERHVKPNLIIVDELHYLQSQQTKRTKTTKSLAKGVKNLIFLSGTPFKNNPAGLFPTLNMLYPDKFDSYRPYARKFCDLKRTPWGWDDRGASNLDKLNKLLKKRIMIRRKAADVFDQLPKGRKQIIKLPITKRKEYENAEKNYKEWLKENYKMLGKGKKKLKAVQLSKTNHLRMLIGELKLKSVYSWLNDFLELTDEKLIVFGIHRKVLRHGIYNQYKGCSVLIDGSTTTKAKDRAIDAFLLRNDIRLMVGNIHALGVGVNRLQEVCSKVAFVELAWTPDAHTQATGRVERIGQTKPTLSYWLLADNTIEERICQKLQAKQRHFDQAVEGVDSDNMFDFIAQQLMTGE